MAAKSVKSVISTVIRKEFHSTALQHWKFSLKVFANYVGNDGIYGFCGHF